MRVERFAVRRKDHITDGEHVAWYKDKGIAEAVSALMNAHRENESVQNGQVYFVDPYMVEVEDNDFTPIRAEEALRQGYAFYREHGACDIDTSKYVLSPL